MNLKFESFFGQLRLLSRAHRSIATSDWIGRHAKALFTAHELKQSSETVRKLQFVCQWCRLFFFFPGHRTNSLHPFSSPSPPLPFPPPLEVAPLNIARGSGGAVSSPSGSKEKPQPTNDIGVKKSSSGGSSFC